MTSKYEQLRMITEDYLLPMLSGSSIESIAPENANITTTVVFNAAPNKLKISRMLNGDSHATSIAIKRGPNYNEDDKAIAKEYILRADDMISAYERSARALYLDAIIMEVVASIVCPSGSKMLSEILSIISAWSQQTYEGQRISAAIGIDETSETNDINLSDILDLNFSKVITNGYDNLITIGSSGTFCNYVELPHTEDQSIIAPVRFVNIANWTTGTNRIAIVLTRNSEILLFKSGQLLFAKRRGRWRHFPHHVIIKQMALKGKAQWPEYLRKTVYTTCLDVSFARSGGCIGMTRANYRPEHLIDGRDMILPITSSIKSSTLNKIINGRKFADSPRILRLSMVGIDGATVIDYKGQIITAGAILKSILCDQSGGGRLAAAKVLGRGGLGIKISNDGEISGYSDLAGQLDKIFSVG